MDSKKLPLFSQDIRQQKITEWQLSVNSLPPLDGHPHILTGYCPNSHTFSGKLLSTPHLSNSPKTPAELRLRFFEAPFRPLDCELHTLIHTFAFEIPLPHIVAISPNSNINVSAIDVKSWMSQKTYHTHIISELS